MRPSDYTSELENVICDGLLSGLSLVQVCKSVEMPHRATVCRWMQKNPKFRDNVALARAEQADLMDDRILDVINKVENCEIEPDAARVVIQGLQWRAAKLAPKKYGDKTTIEQNVTVTLASLVEQSYKVIEPIEPARSLSAPAASLEPQRADQTLTAQSSQAAEQATTAQKSA